MVSAVSSAPVALSPAVRPTQQLNTPAAPQENVDSLIASIEGGAENPNNLISRLSASNASVLLQAQEGVTDGEGLTEEEQEVVEDLRDRDQEVRAHEQAHKSAAGPYAGPISYETQTGPDGREYAIGGSVQIDVSPVPNNPEATIRKADIVERAALAPAQPSSEDFAVARTAQALRQQAQNELADQRAAERNGKEDGDSSGQVQVASASETENNGSAANNPLAITDAQTILSTINQLA